MTKLSPSDDPVMLALLHPFARDLLVLPLGPVLLANPTPLSGLTIFSNMQIWQWWKGLADSLKDYGEILPAGGPEPKRAYDGALVRLPRQREEAQYVMKTAFDRLKEGGIFVAAAANDAGGGRLVSDLSALLPGLQAASKHKCRVVWVIKKNGMALPEAWHDAGILHKHTKTGFWTQPGLFSWDRIDAGTALLLPFIRQNCAGTMADLGCGYGVITDHVLRLNAKLGKAVCIDSDARALEAARRTLAQNHPQRDIDYYWEDLGRKIQLPPVDIVVMNPPFHAERALAIEVGQSFIANAAAILKPNGDLFMVANAHLPYEQILQRSFRKVEKMHEGQGFKIFKARK